MKTKKQNQAPLMTKEEFDQVNSAHQEMLKRDSNEVQRKAIERLVKAWEDTTVEAETEKKKGQENEKHTK